LQPVISGLNHPLSNAYLETNDDTVNPPAASGSGVVTLSEGASGAASTSGPGPSSTPGGGQTGGNTGGNGDQDGSATIIPVGLSALFAVGASAMLLLV